MRIGQNLDLKNCIAARRIQILSRAAQRAALQLNDEQLQGQGSSPRILARESIKNIPRGSR